MTSFTESVVEQAALRWLESVGWQVPNGAEIAPANPRLSEVLFQMEPESYRVYLAEFDEEADGAESGMTADGEAGVSA
jgi:hypothetical protein